MEPKIPPMSTRRNFLELGVKIQNSKKRSNYASEFVKIGKKSNRHPRNRYVM
jgi:hypothetical protein